MTTPMITGYPAQYADPEPWPKPETHSAPPIVHGRPRIAALISSRKATLQRRIDERASELAEAEQALASANALRLKYNTKETKAQVVAATETVTFAGDDHDLALEAMRAFVEHLAASGAELAELETVDLAQSDRGVLDEHAAILTTVRAAGAALANAVKETKALATRTDLARARATDLANGLGQLGWTSGRVDHSSLRTQIRAALRESWRAAGIETGDLERLVLR